jgi:hypothetical protein
LQRTLWKNLNGVWRYRNAAAGDLASPPFGQRLEAPVLVPYCLESALSGILYPSSLLITRTDFK